MQDYIMTDVFYHSTGNRRRS